MNARPTPAQDRLEALEAELAPLEEIQRKACAEELSTLRKEVAVARVMDLRPSLAKASMTKEAAIKILVDTEWEASSTYARLKEAQRQATFESEVYYQIDRATEALETARKKAIEALNDRPDHWALDYAVDAVGAARAVFLWGSVASLIEEGQEPLEALLTVAQHALSNLLADATSGAANGLRLLREAADHEERKETAKFLRTAKRLNPNLVVTFAW